MSTRPTWDRDSGTVEWDGRYLPAAGVFGDDETGFWTAVLPMENKCSLDLYVYDDEAQPVWVTINPEPLDLTDEQRGELPSLDAAIEHGKIVVRTSAVGDTIDERTLSMVFTPSWSCDVEGPDEVLDFLARWGRLPVVRG